ncbi:MAG: serine hydrolase domain-containing protein, partial [Luminiphilus sp.]
MRQSKSLWPWFLVVCLGLLVHGSLASASDGSTRPDRSAPQAVIEDAVHGGKLSFAVAALGTAEGELWSHAAGTRDDRGVESASPDNIIQIASMTKLITTIAALQLVEQGLLALDTPIDAYVPELAGLQVLKGFDAEDEAIFEPALRAPTVRELMTHTAGYVYEIWNADAQKAATLGVTESAFTGGNFLASPLAFQPGTAWEYGINTDWLGVLVEKRSGARLATYFADNIFEPLAMADTYFELPEAKLSRTVTVMARIDGKLAPAPMMQPQSMAPGSMPFYSGGGGLYSTVADYGRILQLLLNGGSLDGMTLLKSETVD